MARKEKFWKNTKLPLIDLGTIKPKDGVRQIQSTVLEKAMKGSVTSESMLLVKTFHKRLKKKTVQFDHYYYWNGKDIDKVTRNREFYYLQKYGK